MFDALRDCVPQLKSAKHEETTDTMLESFDKEIMANLKEVCFPDSHNILIYCLVSSVARNLSAEAKRSEVGNRLVGFARS